MTGREFDADEAFRIGFANRVAPADALEAATKELTDDLLAGFAVPIGLAKRLLDAAAKPALGITLEQEVTAQEVAVASLSATMREQSAGT